MFSTVVHISLSIAVVLRAADIMSILNPHEQEKADAEELPTPYGYPSASG